MPNCQNVTVEKGGTSYITGASAVKKEKEMTITVTKPPTHTLTPNEIYRIHCEAPKAKYTARFRVATDLTYRFDQVAPLE